MKKSIATVMAIVSVLPMLSQNLKYTYDAEGNRVRRHPVAPRSIESEEGAPGVLSTRFSENFFYVTPNPTDGPLTVTVPDFETTQEIYLDIWSVSGNCAYHTNLTSGTLKIDISKFPAGVYFMTLQKEGDTFSKEIIKH